MADAALDSDFNEPSQKAKGGNFGGMVRKNHYYLHVDVYARDVIWERPAFDSLNVNQSSRPKKMELSDVEGSAAPGCEF